MTCTCIEIYEVLLLLSTLRCQSISEIHTCTDSFKARTGSLGFFGRFEMEMYNEILGAKYTSLH